MPVIWQSAAQELIGDYGACAQNTGQRSGWSSDQRCMFIEDPVSESGITQGSESGFAQKPELSSEEEEGGGDWSAANLPTKLSTKKTWRPYKRLSTLKIETLSCVNLSCVILFVSI
jgi:hypothetical protein